MPDVLVPVMLMINDEQKSAYSLRQTAFVAVWRQLENDVLASSPI